MYMSPFLISFQLVARLSSSSSSFYIVDVVVVVYSSSDRFNTHFSAWVLSSNRLNVCWKSVFFFVFIVSPQIPSHQLPLYTIFLSTSVALSTLYTHTRVRAHSHGISAYLSEASHITVLALSMVFNQKEFFLIILCVPVFHLTFSMAHIRLSLGVSLCCSLLNTHILLPSFSIRFLLCTYFHSPYHTYTCTIIYTHTNSPSHEMKRSSINLCG